jgi:hypothetical protein
MLAMPNTTFKFASLCSAGRADAPLNSKLGGVSIGENCES